MKPQKTLRVVETYPPKGTLYLPPPAEPSAVEVFQFNGTEDKPDRVVARFYGLEKPWASSALALAQEFVNCYNVSRATKSVDHEIFEERIYGNSNWNI